jgi:predicted AAA+ superfamily ATPase
MIEVENDFGHCRRLLGERLREPAPGRIQLLTGPRQVGKTTLLLELVREFGEAAIYLAGDEPDAALPGFWERCWTEAEARAQRDTAVLLLDEIHHGDRLRRRHLPLHVVATGSSALRVATGSPGVASRRSGQYVSSVRAGRGFEPRAVWLLSRCDGIQE